MSLNKHEAMALLRGTAIDLDQRVLDALPGLLDDAMARGATLGSTGSDSAVSLEWPVAGAVVSVLLIYTDKWKCIELNAPRSGRGSGLAARTERALLRALPQHGGTIGSRPSFDLSALALKDSQLALADVFDEIAAASFDSSLGYESGLPRLPWSPDELRRLRAVANPGCITLMDRLAAVSPEQSTLAELSPVVGRSARSLAALLGSLSGMVRARFERENWPFNVKQKPAGGWVYWMDERQAIAWHAARGEGSQP